MLRYSHFSLFFPFFMLVIGGLVPLHLTSTLIWAAETQAQTGDGDPSDDENTSHTHSQGNTITLTDKAKANIGLRTAEVDTRAIETIVHVHGNIVAHPRHQAIVTPRIGGIVKRIHPSVGEFIEKGDLLLELESLDLQMAQIEMIEAVAQKKSLESKLAKLKEVLAKEIRQKLQTHQIDYLQSFSELQALQIAIEKRKALAKTKVISALEQMRFRLIKADVELGLLKATLQRTEALAAQRISAQKELLTQQTEYRKGRSELAAAKRQFQILDVNEQTLEKILHDSGETAILSLLNADTLETDALLERYSMLSGEGTTLVVAETGYKIAAITVAANRQRALALGLTETHLENLAKTRTIVSFNDVSTDELIENYLAFGERSQTLETVRQLEEAFRRGGITLNKVRQKLQVSGLTLADIDELVQVGEPSPFFSVTAPASGQIIEQHVTLGTTVERSDTLFSILDTDLVWVEGEVHEDALLRLQDKWQVGDEVRVHVAAYPDTIFTGRISHISDIMNPEERTVHFWAEVNNPTHQLKPGMFAEQTIVLEKGAEVLSVPLNAVLEDSGSWFVFVEFGETYTKQEVVVGDKDDRYIEIKEGLFPEEYVVVQGQHQLLRATADVSQGQGTHGHPH